MGKASLLGVALASGFACAGAFGQFVNAGFESGDFTGWTLANTAGGTGVGTALVESFDIDGPGPAGASLAGRFSVGRFDATQTGNQGITITQLIFLSGGQAYEFGFDWAAFRTIATNNTQGGIFDLIVDGVSIANAAAGPTSGSTPHYGKLVGTFVAGQSGMYSVGAMITRPFTVPAPETLFQYVDNFRVIPTPGASALLCVAGLAGIRRRR